MREREEYGGAETIDLFEQNEVPEVKHKPKIKLKKQNRRIRTDYLDEEREDDQEEHSNGRSKMLYSINRDSSIPLKEVPNYKQAK